VTAPMGHGQRVLGSPWCACPPRPPYRGRDTGHGHTPLVRDTVGTRSGHGREHLEPRDAEVQSLASEVCQRCACRRLQRVSFKAPHRRLQSVCRHTQQAL
jgi:hypothetical protein